MAGSSSGTPAPTWSRAGWAVRVLSDPSLTNLLTSPSSWINPAIVNPKDAKGEIIDKSDVKRKKESESIEQEGKRRRETEKSNRDKSSESGI